MTQDEIRAIALEVAKKMYGGESSDMPEILVDFAARFLAAITEKAEPFCYHYITNGTWDFFTKELPPDDAYDEGTLTKLFTHHAIEPAGEVVVTTTEEGRCVCVTRQDEEGRILKVLWKAPAIEPAPQESRPVTVCDAKRKSPVGAAPLPDAQLCRFYDVNNFPDLVAAMDHHIEKLQAKLPPTPSLWPGRVREG